VQPSDAAAVAEAANHRAVYLALRDSFPSPYSLVDAESFVASPAPASDADPTKGLYPSRVGVFVKPTSTHEDGGEPLFVGCVGADPGEDVCYRTWEVGYWLTPSAWGKGYATEALAAFVPWLLDTWPGIHRVQAFTFANNAQSGKVLLKCGFALEGVQRQAAEKNGVLTDLNMYALLRSDLLPN
jgi:RimJ/RimL family protein N-acetyltransferase